MQHVLPPASPICAESGVPRLTWCCWGSLTGSPCKPGLQEHHPKACWVTGQGAEGGRMPAMETKAGTADGLPGIFQAVGGFGHAKVSYSLEPRLLLLKQILPITSSVCRAQQTKPRYKTRVRPYAALPHKSTAIPGTLVLTGKGGWQSPVPRQTCPAGPGKAELPAGQPPGLTPTALSCSHTLPRGPSPCQCLLVAPAHSASRNALPGHTTLGCPSCPGSSSSSCITTAK